MSISLDAWTSSNNIAFLAIVAHYVTNEGKHGEYGFAWVESNSNVFTEELLIDFRELIGKHTGENMAEAVWETLTLYGIQEKV